MSIDTFDTNINFISALTDEPALTASELKAKFDEAGNTIQDYINDTLVPQIGTELTAISGDIPSVINSLTTGGTTSALSAEQGKTLNTNKQDKVANVSDTEISYLNGVTSAIQTQLNNKQKTISYGTSAPSGGVSGDMYLRYS